MADLESRLENPASEKAAAYLEFEDFSHTGLGLETYEDGLQHPIELRRILTGDLRYFSNSVCSQFDFDHFICAYHQPFQPGDVCLLPSSCRRCLSDP